MSVMLVFRRLGFFMLIFAVVCFSVCLNTKETYFL